MLKKTPMRISTTKTASLKILFDCLASYLMDVNIEIIPRREETSTKVASTKHNEGNKGGGNRELNKEENLGTSHGTSHEDKVNTQSNNIDDLSTKVRNNPGLKILALNSKEGMLIHVKLTADSFLEFECVRSFVLGINMQSLHRIMRTINPNDLLTMQLGDAPYLKQDYDQGTSHVKDSGNDSIGNDGNESDEEEEDNETDIFDDEEFHSINFFVKSPEKMTHLKTYRLPLIRVEGDLLNIEEANFEVAVMMSSVEFQKIIRDLSLNVEAKHVKISITAQNIRFNAHGETGEADFVINEDRTSTGSGRVHIHTKEGADENISGTFDLKNLQLFTKCTQLCSEIQIFMKNNYPILIRYEVPYLGEVHLCQSAIDDEDV